MPIYLRLFLLTALLLSSLAFIGCASDQSDASTNRFSRQTTPSPQAPASSVNKTKAADKVDGTANEKGFTWNRLNPLAWDYRKFGNDFREKYSFKVGDMWLIKPPVDPNPVKIEIHRQVGMPIDWQNPAEAYASSQADAPEQTADSDTDTITDTDTDTDEAVVTEGSDSADAPADSAFSTDQPIDDMPVATRTSETLEIDLVSGKASFTDLDGTIYPLQIRSTTLERIRSLAGERTWIVGKIKPPKDAVDPMHFLVVAYEADHDQQHYVQFTKPARKDLPELFHALMDELDQAHRLAHPLSDTVNLLK